MAPTSGFQSGNNVQVVGGINSRDNDSVHLLANQHFPKLLWFENGCSGSALAFEYLIVVLGSDCILVAQGHYNGVGSLGNSINKHQTTGTGAYDSDSARVCGRHGSCNMTNCEEGLRKDVPLVEYMYDVLPVGLPLQKTSRRPAMGQRR
jgi:hypothetical protein